METIIIKNRIGFAGSVLLQWYCRITDENGEIHTGRSWESAQGAYRLAHMRQRVSQHSPAIYDGTTCVHLRNISPGIAHIFINGKQRSVYREKLDVNYDDDCYVHHAYGGYC